MDKINKKDVKLLIFLDDDDSKKERHAIVKEEEFWAIIQIIDMKTLSKVGETFKIPKERILKKTY